MRRGHLPSVMSHRFSEVPRANIPRSRFDRTHGYKTTFDAGYLVPFYVDEALPGDTHSMHLQAFARMATPIYPVMDNMYMDFFFFAVPIRLLWENWERFNGAQDNPDDSTDYLTPKMTSPGGGYAIGSLSDYLGIPTGVAGLEHVSFWHRAYNLIWNDWFRDENLQDSVVVDLDDGPDDPADYVLLRRNKRHDYFTSALPWPQKGPSVDIPLGTSAPITGLGSINQTYTAGGTAYETDGIGPVSYADFRTSASSSLIWEEDPNNPGFPNIRADLSGATAATINQLRQAFQVQKMYERDARGGTRYTEIVLSHFGVSSPDARLQRPEYLGGGSRPVNITPIANTAGGTSPQGNLAGVGTVNAQGIGFHKSFTEHCVIIGLVNVRADLTYQQGLDRMFSRNTRFDYYWPALAHLGEQAVLNKEIYAQGTVADDEVFGYQERFGEYRYKNSKITGLFRSTAAGTLDAWHLSQEFGSLPTLSDTFIQDNPPVGRVIAVPSEPHFIFDSYMKLRSARPMPVFGTPGLIDHF